MKAATVRRYGGPDVITLETLPLPVLKAGEVLVRVHATPVTAADVRLRSAVVPRGFGALIRLGFGLTKPRRPIPGSGFAGTVAKVAPDVTSLREGQRVFGIAGMRGGAHAEYVAVNASAGVLPLPDSLTFDEGAAFFFGGLTAADFLLDKARMRAGEAVLVVGATGSVGSAAVSLATNLGLRVTAVASTKNLDFARSLGAHDVIDYTQEPLRGLYDGIVDVMGEVPYARAKPLLKPGGRLMPVTGDLVHMLGAALRPTRGTHRITGSTTSEAREKLERLVSLHVAGGYRPVVGACLPFAEIQEAHRVASTWHKRGNLVLQVA